MPIVEFKNVSRVYKSGDHELKALDGVNFSLNEGKFVVIFRSFRCRKKHTS